MADPQAPGAQNPDAITFFDFFVFDNGGRPDQDFDRFFQFTVTDGSVDLVGGVGPGVFGAPPEQPRGRFVDLGGSTGDPGLFQTRQAFAVTAGQTFNLSFDFRSTGGESNTATVSVGDQTFTVTSDQTSFQTFSRDITFTQTGLVRIAFQNAENDRDGSGIGIDGVLFGPVTDGGGQPPGRDDFRGTPADDRFAGSAGDGDIRGLEGDDTLRGGAGDDRITGSEGADRLDGEAGNDTILGEEDNDRALGGGGADRLDGGGGNDALFGGTGTDTLIGGDGNDRLVGGAENDRIAGGAGNDRLLGGAGNDDLSGDAGADALRGGEGGDRLSGGGGRDSFVFADPSDSTGSAGGRDVVIDFEGGLDRIVLSPVDADAGRGGDQAFAFIGATAFSGEAGELRFSTAGNRTVVEGDVDGDGTADLSILLQGRFTLTADDFGL